MYMYMKAGVALVTSNPAGLRGLLSPYLSFECPSKVSPCDFLPKATETAESVHGVLPPTSPESLYNRLARHPSLSLYGPIFPSGFPLAPTASAHIDM
jgi:hypothetical protein